MINLFERLPSIAASLVTTVWGGIIGHPGYVAGTVVATFSVYVGILAFYHTKIRD